jgi:D-arabinose 1-dehydrogenase-like Zn-dependent alcohol dehydrogenase
MGTFDGIIDTVSALHPLMPLMGLLKNHGKLVIVGAPEKPLELPAFSLIGGKRIKKTMSYIDIIPYIKIYFKKVVNSSKCWQGER